jgi:hypothetical protein
MLKRYVVVCGAAVLGGCSGSALLSPDGGDQRQSSSSDVATDRGAAQDVASETASQDAGTDVAPAAGVRPASAWAIGPGLTFPSSGAEVGGVLREQDGKIVVWGRLGFTGAVLLGANRLEYRAADGSSATFLAHVSSDAALLDSSKVDVRIVDTATGVDRTVSETAAAAVASSRGTEFVGAFGNTCFDCDAEWSNSPGGMFAATNMCFSAASMAGSAVVVDVNEQLVAAGWYSGRAFDCNWPYGDEEFGAPNAGGTDMFVRNFGTNRVLTIGGAGNDRLNDLSHGADFRLTLGGSFEGQITAGTASLTAGAQTAGFIAQYDKDFNFFWAKPMTSGCATAVTNVTRAGTDVLVVGTGCGSLQVAGGGELANIGTAPALFAARLRQDGTPVRAWMLSAPSAAAVHIAAGPSGELFVFQPAGVDVYGADGTLLTRLTLPDGLTLSSGFLAPDGQLWVAGTLTKEVTFGPLSFHLTPSWPEAKWLARLSPFGP